jgi:hypothetical protein
MSGFAVLVSGANRQRAILVRPGLPEKVVLYHAPAPPPEWETPRDLIVGAQHAAVDLAQAESVTVVWPVP